MLSGAHQRRCVILNETKRFPTLREGYKSQASGRHEAFVPETERANRLVRVESLMEPHGA